MIRSKPYKIFFLAVGWFFTGLGFIGLILPLVPTTPFLLVAVWAFNRSSSRMMRWLLRHRLLGPHLIRWYRYGAINSSAKTLAVFVLCLSFLWAAVMIQNLYVLIGLLILFIFVSGFILTRPSGEQDVGAQDEV